MLCLQSRSFLLLYSLTLDAKYWPVTLTLRNGLEGIEVLLKLENRLNHGIAHRHVN